MFALDLVWRSASRKFEVISPPFDAGKKVVCAPRAVPTSRNISKYCVVKVMICKIGEKEIGIRILLKNFHSNFFTIASSLLTPSVSENSAIDFL